MSATSSSAGPHSDAEAAAPRQTYRRARVATPPTDEPRMTFTVPIAAPESTATILSRQSEESAPAVSPSKALLSRWEGRGLSFLNSLGGLDVGRADVTSDDGRKGDDDEQDPAELKMFIHGLKKQYQRNAAGAVRQPKASASGQPSRTLPSVPETKSAIPPNRLGVSFSSSSLTDLPTSTPPSSPPRLNKTAVVAPISIPPPRASEVVEEETFAIRKSSTARPARRRVVASSDEDSDREVRASPSSPSPSPRRAPRVKHLSPPTATAKSRLPSSESDSGSTPGKAVLEDNKEYASDTLERSDTEEDRLPKPSRADAYLAQLFEENRQADAQDMGRTGSADSAETIKDPVGSFEGNTVGAQGALKIKSLNRKEQDQLKRDMDRARREREVIFSRPIAKSLPISSYFAEATRLFTTAHVKDEVPKLVQHTHSSPSTALITPPDDITAFTPSSHDKVHRRKNGPVTYRRRSQSPDNEAHRQSSPTTNRRIQVGSDDETDAPLMRSNMQLLQDVRQEQAKKKLAETRRAELAQIKAAALTKLEAERAARGKEANDLKEDDELDFTVSPVKPVPAKSAKPDAAVRTRGPDAKAVLLRDQTAVPAITKQRQLILAKAGKSARSKPQSEVISETYAEFAGRTFKHDNLRSANAGSRPAGQKAGRDRALRPEQLALMLSSGHAVQAKSIRDKKEQDFGRARVMPGKTVKDWQELVDISARRIDNDIGEGDEDEEDDDFMSSDDDEDENLDRGSADEADDEEVTEGVDEDAGSQGGTDKVETEVPEADQENDENISPIKVRRPRHTTRFAIASDDEDDAPAPVPATLAARAPLSEIAAPRTAIQATPNGDDLDLGGFGDADEGGFSQLFEPTQLNGPSVKEDGFAGLRTEAAGLLPAYALLPQNIISETQALRDNALIAAEIEEALEPVQQNPVEVKKQYLNDAGFFTQTKPRTQYPSQMPDTARRQLAGSSDISLLNGLAASPDKVGESTERSPAAPSSETAQPDSPAADGQALRRLRRRDSSDEFSYAADAVEPTQITSPPAPARERDALSYLMANRHRHTTKQPVKTNLVDEQAEESDEDDGWGDSARKGDDDDEGEEGEGFVEGLVDDQVVDEATKRAQDELAEEKRREIEQQDDTKREEQARKITEGQFRTRRRGQDFFSSGSEDEDGKPKRWNKRQRRLRRLEGEDGLMKLQGEENVFRQAYEVDLDSDNEDILVDEPGPFKSPGSARGPAQSYRERREALRKMGEANRQLGQDNDSDRLDRELGFDRNGTLLLESELGEEEAIESFFINKARRVTSLTSIALAEEPESLTAGRVSGVRSAASYLAYVTEESQTHRRGVGISSASVVMNQSIPIARPGKGDGKYNNSRRSTGPTGSGFADRLLVSKTKSFA